MRKWWEVDFFMLDGKGKNFNWGLKIPINQLKHEQLQRLLNLMNGSDCILKK